MTTTALRRVAMNASAPAFGSQEPLSQEPLKIETAAGPIGVRLYQDLEPARPAWEELQQICACSPSQTYSYAECWLRHVTGPEGRRAVVAVGYDQSQAVLLLPFELRRKFGQTVLVWLGQGHANYNMGLFRSEFGAKLKAKDLQRLLGAIASEVGAQAALLEAQPGNWNGLPNPFALLKHQPHPSSGHAVTLGDFETVYNERFSKSSRKKYRTRERKLGEYGEFTFGWAGDAAERREVMETFFAQREVQFAQMGVEDPFTPPIRDFYRDLSMLPDHDPARLRLGFLRVGDFIAATFSGSVCQNIFSASMSSLGEGEMQRYSPGLVLLRRQIEWACNEDLLQYDIGAGDARHKARWCDVVRPLFDSFIAFSPQGLLVTLPLAGASRGKRTIKQNRVLWPLAKKIRRKLFSHSVETDNSNDD